MIRRRNLRTRSIKLLVLDEADEMLNKGIEGICTRPSSAFKILSLKNFNFFLGFKEQIYDVYRYLPPATQVSTYLYILLLKCKKN